MKLEELLAAVPLDQWKVGQVYSIDWYDGPRGGVCALTEPPCEFYFELLDERYNPNGLDDRLFRLSELPSGSVQEVLSAAHDVQESRGRDHEQARRRMDAVTARARPTSVVIHTQDMEQILGFWNLGQVAQARTDWFAALGIPKHEPLPEED